MGHSERIAVESNQLIAEGVVSRDTTAAREIVASGKRGFPWQASIAAQQQETTFMDEPASGSPGSPEAVTDPASPETPKTPEVTPLVTPTSAALSHLRLPTPLRPSRLLPRPLSR